MRLILVLIAVALIALGLYLGQHSDVAAVLTGWTDWS